MAEYTQAADLAKLEKTAQLNIGVYNATTGATANAQPTLTHTPGSDTGTSSTTPTATTMVDPLAMLKQKGIFISDTAAPKTTTSNLGINPAVSKLFK